VKRKTDQQYVLVKPTPGPALRLGK
jgi:hypothetical protein